MKPLTAQLEAIPMASVLEAFMENEASLRRFVQRYLGTTGDPEDALQEAFLLAFKAEQTQNIVNPKAFLFTVAKNIALGEHRRERASPIDRREVLEKRPELYLGQNEASDVPANLEGRRKLFILVTALLALPPRCREAFLMRRVDGLSFKEIAASMNISVSAAEKHVATGLLRCRRALVQAGYEPKEFGATGKGPSPLPADTQKGQWK